MAVIGTPGGHIDTRLFSSAWNISIVADRFTHIGNSIEGVFIIGHWLSWPFREIGNFLWSVAQYMMEANNVIGQWLNWVRYIIDGNGFLQLLRWASHHFEQIRLNPFNWIVNIVRLIIWWFDLFLFNPVSWIRMFLISSGWQWALLFQNPVGFIEQYIVHIRHWLRAFLDNPVSFVIEQIRHIMPDIWSFLYNPIGYVINVLFGQIWDFGLFRINPSQWIIARINEASPGILDLLYNPQHYLQARIAFWLDMSPYLWSNPKFYLIDELLRKVDEQRVHFQHRLAQLFIEIVLYFI